MWGERQKENLHTSGDELDLTTVGSKNNCEVIDHP